MGEHATHRRRLGATNGRVHGEIDVPVSEGSGFDAVYALVRAIPGGRVMTYGQIAGLLGNALSPKAVGWAMHGCPDDVPWHRVVNAAGRCSTERLPEMPPGVQRALLEREGVTFALDGTLDLERFRYVPPVRAVRVRAGSSEG